MRRTVYEQLSEIRLKNYVRKEHQLVKLRIRIQKQNWISCTMLPIKQHRKFYERHGVTEIEKAFELQWDPWKISCND